ncbi:hypothetical protein A3L04_02680 [Thermococcus chitonophagus]|uniref:Predicted membrane protein n=1 Tax=Thermococcus chitonophagus TaxID=54262 RepID=A0A170SE81_9EURY|nr:hypothetical protein [Thermococcus chitonophagus]ASJ16061.1 hypothetical protein A3L04_02680 [Thermococcus chitonophagus]CUX77308.1 predicted membrane protein [Thermococcus chitonophagus]
MMKNKKLFIATYTLYVVVAIFALRKFTIAGNITSIHSWVGDPELFLRLYGQPYSWNYHLTRSENVIQFLSRLFYMPFAIISKHLNISMFRVLPWIYVLLFSIAGFSMFYAVYSIIERDYRNSITTYISSVLAGLYYMSYPFFAIGELTEIFVMFGFSLFPLVVIYFIKGLEERSSKYIILSVILGTYSGFFDIRYLFASFIVYITYTIYHLITCRIKKCCLLETLKIWIMLITVFILFGGLNLFIFASSQSEYANIPLNKEAYLITWKEGDPIKLLNGFSWFLLPEQMDWGSLPISRSIQMALALVIPILSILALILTHNKKRIVIPRRIYYFAILLSLTVALFSSKEFVNWLVTESPENFFIGRMFRTPRIPAQLISISVGILFGVSVREILERIKHIKRSNALLSITIIILTSIIIIGSFPFFMYGTINKWFVPFTIPQGYIEVNDFLRSTAEDRAIWFPLSSPRWYMPKSGGTYFYIYNSEVPTIWPSFNRWVYFMDFTLSSKHSLLNKGNTDLLADILGNIGIKYLIISNDTTRLINRKIIGYLNKSEDFMLIFNNSHYYVYKVLDNTSKISTKSIIVIGGGLKTLEDLWPLKFSNGCVVLLDDNINKNVIRYSDTLVLPFYSHYLDIMVHFINRNDIYPLTRYNKEGARYPTDPHHGMWTPYVSNLPHRWEYPYKMDYGFFTFDKVKEVKIPINIPTTSSYITFARVFKNNEGGKLKFRIDNFSSTIINTRVIDDARFVWVKVGEVNLNRGLHTLNIESINGKNAINIIAIIPKEEYLKTKKYIERLFSNKSIIYELKLINSSLTREQKTAISIMKNGTYRFALKGSGVVRVSLGNYSYVAILNNSRLWYSPLFYLTIGTYNLTIEALSSNILQNPSFENGTSGWSIGNTKFNVSLDNTTSIDGIYSLKVKTNITKPLSWSWIESVAMNVTPGREYIIVTHMKTYNVNGSNIPIEGYFENFGKWQQLRQCPTGRTGTGTFNWTEYRCIVKIPENVTKIRIILNAGWVLDPRKGPAITWFDGIGVYPVDKLPVLDVVWLYSVNTPKETLEDLFIVNGIPATVKNYTRINPTLWRVKVYATKPFFLTFAEAYDPLWEARVYKDGKLVEKVKPVPVYGVINGFWINQTGNLTIILRYIPQDWFERGLVISATTFIFSILYIFYDWRRERGDRWAKKVEKITQKSKQKLVSIISSMFRKLTGRFKR